MSKIRITELAEMTGFAASTIRFYENTGLLPAASRTSSGHRVYTEHDVDRLRFIARGKHMGLALDEIRELVLTCDAEEAAAGFGAAGTLRARIAEVNERIAELSAFSAQLAANLAALRAKSAPAAETDVACRKHWASALAHPHTYRHLDGLLTVTFPANPALTAVLVELVAHESACPKQSGIVLQCDGRATTLEVTAADSTRALIEDLREAGGTPVTAGVGVEWT